MSWELWLFLACWLFLAGVWAALRADRLREENERLKSELSLAKEENEFLSDWLAAIWRDKAGLNRKSPDDAVARKLRRDP